MILIGVFVVGAIVFHILERKYAPVIATYKTGPRRSYLADFTAALIEGPVLSSISKIFMYTAIIYAPQFHFDGMSTWPWWAQMLVFLLVNDFLRYWLHRWHHTNNFLWRMHRVHHTIVEMDAMSTFRVHILEAVIKYGLIVLPFHFVNVDRSVILIYSAVDILKGFWHHANLRAHWPAELLSQLRRAALVAPFGRSQGPARQLRLDPFHLGLALRHGLLRQKTLAGKNRRGGNGEFPRHIPRVDDDGGLQ
ncbi:MAG: sterol desaturase family protein [Planctomycetes bacterium]|nr:sterol desaturase family protein [Planctomycetota bacterium]